MRFQLDAILYNFRRVEEEYAVLLAMVIIQYEVILNALQRVGKKAFNRHRRAAYKIISSDIVGKVTSIDK